MNTIRELLARKGNSVWSIDPDATVMEALWVMADHDVGSLLVLQAGELTGILTDRDYARRVVLQGRSTRDTLVSEIMTRPVYTIHPDQSCHDAMEIMSDAHVRHLPVVENERICGVISMRDVMEEIIFDQRDRIRFWEDLTLDR